MEQTIEAREELSARIKALGAEMADWNKKLLAVVLSGGEVIEGKTRYSTDRFACQVVEYDSTRLDKDKLKAYLVDTLDLSPSKVAKAFAACSTTEHIGPYIRVDPIKSAEEKAAESVARAEARAAKARRA